MVRAVRAVRCGTMRHGATRCPGTLVDIPEAQFARIGTSLERHWLCVVMGAGKPAVTRRGDRAAISPSSYVVGSPCGVAFQTRHPHYRSRLISPRLARLMLALLLPALINHSRPVIHYHKVHSIILSYPAIYHTYTTMSSALQPRKMSKYQISFCPPFQRSTSIRQFRLVRPSRWAHRSGRCRRASRS